MPVTTAASVASVLALSPPSGVAAQKATATAATQLTDPSSAHRPQLQHPQPVLSDATAALVAAVGPLFESFVAQTAAVVADPGVSLQTLAGSITQNLAAAIASAAVQVVTQRRQQLTPTAGHCSADTPLPQAPKTNALALTPVLPGGLAPAVVAPTQAIRLPNSSGLSESIGARKPAQSVAGKGSKQAKQHTADGVQDTGTEKGVNQGADFNNGSGSVEGHRKRVAASSEVVATSRVDRNQKQAGSSAKDQQSSGAKRQKTGVPSLKAIPSKHASKSDTSSSDRAQNGSMSSENKARGHKGSMRGSPVSRGSGKSSPKEYGSFDGVFPTNSQRVASPLPVGRNSPGSSFQHVGAPALLPSRLSDSIGSGSAMMSGPLPFALGTPGHLSFQSYNVFTDMLSSPQAELANRFMPVMPASPGDWLMHPPALNDCPMAAHFLPGITEAPDFSPVD